MSDNELRSKLIRLAHQKPELREHLLPLISKKAYGDDSYAEWKSQWWAVIGQAIKPHLIKGRILVNVEDHLEFRHNGTRNYVKWDKRSGKIYLVTDDFTEVLGTSETSQDEIIQTIYMLFQW